ncbi:MAG: bifunctional oligoribonuclease/PAP phosphatase NrnA [Terriglobales bacterium]|jgi:phosphoesterase RecJ-like protein
MLDKVLQAIRDRHRFVVTSHARPDGDGIGSALACGQILRAMGKDADVVIYDGIPRIYQELPFANRALRAQVVPPNDAVILLECDSTRRALLEGLDQCFLINIDHHVSGRNFADINWIDSSVMATAELVYRLARLACVPIDRDIATCLYTALMTDTGSFMFEGTNEHTFTVARELVLAGADPAQCARHIYFGHSTSKMRLLGAALTHLHRDGPLAWIWVTQEQMARFGAREEDCEGLVNYALSMGDVQVAIFFRELPDGRYRVSLRSKGEVNVSTVAEQFGGGGHKCASGFSLDGPLAIAVSKVVDRLRPPTSVQNSSPE